MKILFISLGCDKNLADSEEMLGLLTGSGHEIVDSEEEAEAIEAIEKAGLKVIEINHQGEWVNITAQKL